MKHTLKLLSLAILATALCFGQGTALTSTTLSSAMTIGQTTVVLASSTGVTAAGSQNQFNTVIWVDNELIGIKSLVTGTTWSVQRGLNATRPYAHASGAIVLLGSPTGNFSTTPLLSEVAAGAPCVVANQPTLPHIYTQTGHAFDCIAAGVWIQVSSPGHPVLGSTVASPAGVMTATGTVFHVSGTNAVTGLTVPNGFAPGMSVTIIPDAVFTWTTATNFGLAGTAVVNKALILTWSGSKWIPSYIA